MFTGLVEELGEVAAVEQLAGAARITIAGPVTTTGAAAGDSIAVNGTCLTITAINGSQFTADVMAETLRRTSLGALVPGSRVNLERPVPMGGRLGGHLVQGHVDAVATVISRTSSGHWDLVRFTIPPGLARYLVEKGSVAVDGVSLTVAALGDGVDGQPPWFEVSLIPTTLAATTLGAITPGSPVNLEADMIAKYVERMLTTTGVRS
jgi:riboflavin synthase